MKPLELSRVGCVGTELTRGDRSVNKKADATLNAIEETQAALRDSIEQAKQLAEKSEALIQQHRKETEEGSA